MGLCVYIYVCTNYMIFFKKYRPCMTILLDFHPPPHEFIHIIPHLNRHRKSPFTAPSWTVARAVSPWPRCLGGTTGRPCSASTICRCSHGVLAKDEKNHGTWKPGGTSDPHLVQMKQISLEFWFCLKLAPTGPSRTSRRFFNGVLENEPVTSSSLGF